ncbi:hypothetical protein QWZ04_16895 [Vibrio tapetis subsp. quintayensis]|uniref:DUF6701 domain-containing protein n=1 Tax=Vibrio tapetis TaxID=52443 RepID=UPI0025B53EB9|nr:DUF6701 domain-containing protein [Vibrio tapetis]MDN3681986.1 hypothetical protein [Vibrio tapetis subsp. quintayensis]
MRLILRLLGVLLLLVSFSSLALELEYGRYNVNAFPHADCIDTVCEIIFDETYATAPLVFFMDTVSFQDETDRPSTIRILDVNTTRVRFQQKFAPNTTEPGGMQDLPMKVIDYLVIEKGVHNFSSGVQVLAGDINTNKFRTRIDIDINPGTPVVRPPNRNQRERVKYNQFNGQGFTGFASKPGIIHQVQSVANGADFWLTSTVYNVNSNRFDMALERSEIDGKKSIDQRGYPTQNERIGFLAAVGSGEKDDIKFSIETQQTTNSYNTGDPVSTGCETYADYDSPYDVVPIIIASKNTRSGGDGGWVRRCRLETAKSSFMVDEDQDTDAERMHIVETLGYIIFEVPFTVQQCTQFTGAVQTWDTDGELKMVGSSKITGAVPNNRVGFASINVTPNTSCDTGTCVADPSLMVPNYSFASYSPGSSNYSVASGTHTLSSGFFGEITISGDAHVTLNAGDYWADEIKIIGNARIFTNGEVFLHANEFTMDNSAQANMNLSNGSALDGIARNLNIIVHGDDAEAKFLNDVRVTGFVITENEFSITGSSQLTGAVAAFDIGLKGASVINGDISSCNNDTQQLNISPMSATQVVNQSIPITFSIVNSQGAVDGNAYGNLNLTHSGGAQVCWKVSEASTCLTDASSIPIQAGIVTYYLFSSVQTEVDISAVWVEKPTVNASAGKYNFEINGFIFEPSPLLMIAGQNTTVTIKAVDNTGTVLPSYEGIKSLEVSATAKMLPVTGNLNASLVTGNITFSSGVGTALVHYADAGTVSVSIEEVGGGVTGDMLVHSRPHTFAICNITSTGLNQGHTGTATSGNGFAKAGEAFSVTIKPVTWLGSAISGDDSGDGNNDVISDVLCSQPTTPNYYTAGGQFARVKLSHALHTPAGKEPGALIQPSTTDQHYNFTTTGEAQSGLVISNLSWSEVGSLWLQADFPNYALGAVEQGIAAIGRFYPDHFALSSSVVNEGQSNFTYMKQGFGAQFEVAAQAVGNTTTLNYPYLTNYVMAIQLKAVDASKTSPTTNDLTSRIDMSTISSSGWESDWSAGTLGIPISILKFNRVEESSSPLKTIPDGPYRVRMGLEVNEGTVNCATQGCTYFDSTDEYRNDGSGVKDVKGLTEELDVRYGRMTMSDIGGISGANLTVPLKAEYWNGSNFVINTLDSGSAFNSDNFCRLRIWPTSGATAVTMTGAGNVTVGDSDDLVAIQNQVTNDVREQVKLWLRIGAVPTSFETGLHCEGVNTGNMEHLHYNWDGRGDENPRATITFGVYRGNDRVIYRGEPRMY